MDLSFMMTSGDKVSSPAHSLRDHRESLRRPTPASNEVDRNFDVPEHRSAIGMEHSVHRVQ